jgi:hypothetical protein
MPSSEKPCTALTSLVIDRSRWHRGDSTTSALLAKDGRMCCLGILGAACGIPEESLYRQGEPDQVEDPRWPAWVVAPDEITGTRRNTAVVGVLIAINDRVHHPETREAELATEFAKHGVAVTFTDGPTP